VLSGLTLCDQPSAWAMRALPPLWPVILLSLWALELRPMDRSEAMFQVRLTRRPWRPVAGQFVELPGVSTGSNGLCSAVEARMSSSRATPGSTPLAPGPMPCPPTSTSTASSSTSTGGRRKLRQRLPMRNPSVSYTRPDLVTREFGVCRDSAEREPGRARAGPLSSGDRPEDVIDTTALTRGCISPPRLRGALPC
jgi:hypothetical protein